MLPARLVVLASGEGTTLQALLDAAGDPSYGAEIVAVGSDRPTARALERAEAADAATFCVDFAAYGTRTDFDAALEAALADRSPDLVVCAGYMKLIAASTVRRFRIVNTHPSLLPAFPGAHAIRDALAYGVQVSGVTVHVVDEGLDSGPILAQAPVAVEPGDDEDALRTRIQAVERGLYVETVGRLARGDLSGWPHPFRTRGVPS